MKKPSYILELKIELVSNKAIKIIYEEITYNDFRKISNFWEYQLLTEPRVKDMHIRLVAMK